jgi:hypothetical protein
MEKNMLKWFSLIFTCEITDGLNEYIPGRWKEEKEDEDSK